MTSVLPDRVSAPRPLPQLDMRVTNQTAPATPDPLAGMTPAERSAHIDRNVVLKALVTQDGDIVGNVAYSIYKQHKNDWFEAFQSQNARDPNDAEIGSYVIGETTPRRVATYRFLASASLNGQGVELSATPSSMGFAERRFNSVSKAPRSDSDRVQIISLIAFVLLLALAATTAVRYGILNIIR